MAELIKLQRLTTPVKPDVTPTVEGVIAPAQYANYVRIAFDANGFTFYFFAVPSDLLDLPQAKKQLLDERGEPRSQLAETLKLELPPVGKIILPPSVMPVLLEVLGNVYTTWLKLPGAGGPGAGSSDK